MRRSIRGGILIVALLAGAARQSMAQETGTPIFKAPYRAFTSHEVGVAFSDPGEGVSLALEGSYAFGSGPYDWSIRGGFEDLNGDAGTRGLIGGGFRTRVLSYSESFPLDGALTLGAGGNFGDGDDFFYLPIGFSLGRRFELEGSKTTFTPYAHPVLVPVFGGGDSNLDFALGLGVDMRFSGNWAVRVSGGIGDLDGVGIGLTYIR
jgi:opacity protein-like surface antigen